MYIDIYVSIFKQPLTGLSTLSANFMSVWSFCSCSSGDGSAINIKLSQDKKQIRLKTNNNQQ